MTKVFVVKPQTYMNLSGPAVRDIMAYHGMSLEPDLADDLLVVHDDLDLSEGKLRFRARGSAGGHRGVASIISCLGHGRFSRLKVGVGRPEGAEALDYVLEKLDDVSRRRLEEAADLAAAALRTWLDEGIEQSMNRFNAGPGSLPETGDRAPSAGTGKDPGGS